MKFRLWLTEHSSYSQTWYVGVLVVVAFSASLWWSRRLNYWGNGWMFMLCYTSIDNGAWMCSATAGFSAQQRRLAAWTAWFPAQRHGCCGDCGAWILCTQLDAVLSLLCPTPLCLQCRWRQCSLSVWCGCGNWHQLQCFLSANSSCTCP